MINKKNPFKIMYLRKYKRYTNLNIIDRFLNWLDFIVLKHGKTFFYSSMLFLIIVLLIDIFQKLI